MALTPVEIRHLELKRSPLGYRKSAVHRMLDDIADSFEDVWRERSQLAEQLEELEAEVARHLELEGLLRSTLVSAERASQDLRAAARREADVIVSEANAEARKLLRDAITEKETLGGEVRRIRAVLHSALAVVDEAASERRDATPQSLEATQEEKVQPGGVTAFERVVAAAPPVLPPEASERTDPGFRRLA